ncbi:MAG: sensor histidine kinase [Flavobacterium sp.]|nr:sensor histidine kinase [Flavobacterium sp.]
MIKTIYEIRDEDGKILYSNLPDKYYYDSSNLLNRIKIGICPITKKQVRHGIIKSNGNQIYIASYDVATNKMLKPYFEAIEFFIPNLNSITKSSKESVKQDFRRFKHNLITQHTLILQELEKSFSLDTNEKGINNQIEFIEKLLIENPRQSAISILKLIKNVNLMKAEFDVYDMLSIKNPSLEFFTHNPHKLTLLVLNPFWLELIEKGIKINISECKGEVYIDYRSISVALSHIFENTSKYICRNTTLNISFTDQINFIVINFEMISLKIKPEEKEKIFEDNYSGEYAVSTTLAGSGLGMSVVKKLTSLNRGEITVEIDTDERLREKVMGIPYEKNIIRMKLPVKK